MAAGTKGCARGGGWEREGGNQADTRLHAPRLRLNNKLELFILATLFATDRHLLQGLGRGRGHRPSASTEVVENRRCAFFMIISSVACHVNFTYTSLYSFTAEGGVAGQPGMPDTHTHTSTHTERGLRLLFVIRKPPEPSSQLRVQLRVRGHPVPCAVLADRSANGDCNSFLCLDSLLILLRSSSHWGRKCFSFPYIDPSGPDKSIETMERPLQTRDQRDQQSTVFVVHTPPQSPLFPLSYGPTRPA